MRAHTRRSEFSGRLAPRSTNMSGRHSPAADDTSVCTFFYWRTSVLYQKTIITIHEIIVIAGRHIDSLLYFCFLIFSRSFSVIVILLLFAVKEDKQWICDVVPTPDFIPAYAPVPCNPCKEEKNTYMIWLKMSNFSNNYGECTKWEMSLSEDAINDTRAYRAHGIREPYWRTSEPGSIHFGRLGNFIVIVDGVFVLNLRLHFHSAYVGDSTKSGCLTELASSSALWRNVVVYMRSW